MTEKLKKLFLVPIDGSNNALHALDYLGHLFGAGPDINIELLYIVPAMSPILIEESRYNRETAAMIKKTEKKHLELARKVLEHGRQRLVKMGFNDEQLKTTLHGETVSVAADICDRAEDRAADSLVISSRGRGRLESYFMGATATKVIDAIKVCPAWIIKNKVTAPGVLIAVDRSKEALRAVDHAGFILAGTHHPVTLFYSRRKLTSFVPHEVVEEAPDLERIWQDRAGKAIAPVMETAQQMLIEAGVAESRITVRVKEGTRSAAGDIAKTARELECGTIVVGRRGTGEQSKFNMGSVSRKVLETSDNSAVWIVP